MTESLLFRNENNSLVIALNGSVHKILKDYSSYFNNTEKNSIDWVKGWSNKKILNDKTIKELFNYDGLSLWWLMEGWIYQSYKYGDPWQKILTLIEELDVVVSKEQPEQIATIGLDRLHNQILERIAEKYKIPFEKTKEHTPNKVHKLIYASYISFVYRFRKLYWQLSKTHKFNNAKAEVLLFSTGPWTKDGNPYLATISDKLKSYKTIDATDNFQLDLKALRQESKQDKFELLENYGNPKIIRRARQLTNKYRMMWEKIKENPKIIKSFQYRRINVWYLLEPRISSYLYIRLFGHIFDIELIKEVIRKEKPKVALFPAETSEFARSLFHICRKHNVKTVAVQHGLFQNSIRCIHSKQDVSDKDAISYQYVPLPDAIAVYGNFYQRCLTEQGNYPKNKIFLVGFHRLDTLIQTKHLFDKNKIYNQLGIGSGKKVITIATLHNEETREATFDITTDAIAKMRNTHLIIKMHPFEKDRKTYEAMLQSKGLKDYIILREIDIQRLLYISDIVITTFSTIGIEAIILDKPLIIVNVTEKPLTQYTQYGAAIPVTDSKGLYEAIQKIYKNKETQDTLKLGRDKFIKDYNYKNDGKASERIVEVVENLVRV